MEQIIGVLLRATGVSQFGSQMAQIAGSASVAQRAVQGVQSTMQGFKALAAGAIGGLTVASVARLGSEFENTQNKMAGFLSSLGQAPNFNSALKLSADVMKQIELTSAVLPGEAEDYVRVFTTALPNVQRSIGGTMEQMVAFTNQIAAVGATFGIDSMQVANDLNRMLQVGHGGAGLDVRTFTSMLPFLQQVEGYANLTAESFNKMNEQARAKLLQKAMSSLAPMIDHASNSFDAVKGTSVTILKTMFRMSTASLFSGLKDSLSRVNKLLMDQNGNLTALGQKIVDYGKRASSLLAELLNKGVTALEAIFSNADKIPEVFERIEKAVRNAAVAYGVYSVASAAGGAALSGGLAATSGAAKAPGSVSTLGANILSMLGVKWSQGRNELGQFTALVAPRGALAVGLTAVAAAAAVAGSAAYVLATDWESFAPRISEVGTQFSTQVMPAMKRAAEAAWKITEPFVKFVGTKTTNFLIDSVEVLGFVLTKTADQVTAFADAVSYLSLYLPTRSGNKLLQAAKDLAEKRRREKAARDYRFDMRKHLNVPFRMAADFDPKTAPKPAASLTPLARGGAKIHQDFRGSRFSIDQKFEEGFDPDRVAVAFANDLRKIGEYRAQSGLEPLFGLGL